MGLTFELDPSLLGYGTRHAIDDVTVAIDDVMLFNLIFAQKITFANIVIFC